jgi:diaminopropionate ammonia-lyase
MAMLECYTPSIIAWRILQRTADMFMTVTEQQARDAMRALAYRGASRSGIVAGESGAAGYAGLRALASDMEARQKLGLDSASRVLLINTEGATDPGTYQDIVGASPEAIANQSIPA